MTWANGHSGTVQQVHKYALAVRMDGQGLTCPLVYKLVPGCDTYYEIDRWRVREKEEGVRREKDKKRRKEREVYDRGSTMPKKLSQFSSCNRA